MVPVVSVNHLVKSNRSLEAVSGVTFSVGEGELFGLFGPNGAGKSTIIKILCSLTDLKSGAASVNGFEVTREPDSVRRSIGIIFQDPSLNDRLTRQYDRDGPGRVELDPRAVRWDTSHTSLSHQAAHHDVLHSLNP